MCLCFFLVLFFKLYVLSFFLSFFNSFHFLIIIYQCLFPPFFYDEINNKNKINNI